VYGPRQNPHGEAGVVAIFCNKLLNGDPCIINGDGMQTRDYVYVGDVVNANVFALGMEGTDTFNVCTNVESTVNDIFHHLNKAAGSKADEKHGPAKPGEQLRSVCTWKKIHDTLGWKPTVEVEQGLQQTMAYFKRKHDEE
jgi:UDP-glucose 4-epimerase